ncbi:CoA transferase [Saccharopolyspora sp. NPDC050389]|uniref:CaiB/BaiF CoA-transferase family protein n=1 Tax=Saccharopolyspora sp. NPDC050389 TaxID=3155516 RepID=UPI0033E6D672
MSHCRDDDPPAPLRALRVVDTTDGRAEMCGRHLADLGAEVIRVEPPDGAGTRTAWPRHGEIGLRDAAYNAGKLGVTLDLDDPGGRADLVRLLSTADIWLTTARDQDFAEIRRRVPALVIVSVTDFGLTGPYRDFVATEWVLAAMAGVLCRSGVPGRRPLLPPHEIVEQAAAAQATWCALVGHYRRLTTGRGDHLDVSLYETAIQVFDPAFGAGPTAGYGRQWWEFPHGRPDVAHYYPVYPCADGHVRVCLLSAAQWRAMRAWLGEPAGFQDAKYDTILERQHADDRLRPLITELFAGKRAMDVALEGQRRGIPVAPLLELGAVAAVEHFQERGIFAEAEIAPGVRGVLPRSCIELDDRRIGPARPSPELGEHDELLDSLPPLPPLPPPVDPGTADRGAPFTGLRVLDLGVIVVGAEAGRLFADLGADVIKVENSAHPDASRAPFDGTVSSGFAWGHRGKRSLSVDLRDPRGRELFERLAETADVLLSNFRPGTLEKLGIGHRTLAEINPRLVVVESSAVGHTGPWRNWMGYGPLVRAVAGLTALWRDPEVPDGFADGVTVYPDHLVGRVVDTAALAVLIERRETGRGRRVTCSQAEAILNALSAQVLRESLEPGSAQPHGDLGEDAAPYGVFPCAGDDEWCVITVRGDADYQRLRGVIELPEPAHREKIDAQVAEWTARRTPEEVMRELQRVGVPAGPMRRIPSYATDPALRERRAFGTLYQPTVATPLPTENAQCRSDTIAAPSLRPAPAQGQHTREICTGLLGMDDAAVDALIDAGVLVETDPWQPLRTPGASA